MVELDISVQPYYNQYMRCTICCEDKSEDDFAFRNKAAGVRRKQCKSCVSEMDKRRYLQSEERRASVARQRKDNKMKSQAYVRNHLASGCVDCGIKDIRVLEFDHLDNFEKIDGVATMARKATSIKTLEAEIAKCEVRCKNCHAIKTYERGGWTYGHVA